VSDDRPHAPPHEDEAEPFDELDDEVFTFRLRLIYQSASWPATVWSAFACILSVCLAAVAIAGILSWAPAENVTAMGNLFRKPGDGTAPPKSMVVFSEPVPPDVGPLDIEPEAVP
jgi:hypothetical protein